MLARWAIPASLALVLGTSAANAAALSSTSQIGRTAPAATGELLHKVAEGNQLRAERQLRRQELGIGRSGLRRDYSGKRYNSSKRYRNRYGRRHYRNRGLQFGVYPFVPSYGYDYGYSYSYSRPRYSSGSCGYWSSRCVENWGYGNSNYYGCLRYHGC
jgi:hypothetical protein